ncbi:MAG: phage late control D family protein [Schwartzia sp.]|nr:phage late control D family protein [Schwartzia sp. (in: firmicutes)]
MDQGSYTYTDLAEKNDNFTAPGFEILVDDKTLAQTNYSIPGVEVEISGTGAAGGCSFTIEGQYDFKNSKWLNDAAKLIKPGAKLAVKGGYKNRKELFYGYVDEYSLEFLGDGTPRISVNGLDGLGYLMNMCEPFYAGEKKPKEIVQSVLQKSQSAGYAKSVKVGALDGFETPIIKEQIDDWKFLCMMAERYGASLFAVNGELIFDDVMTKTSPIVTLTLGKSLRSFSKRVSLAHQVGKVEVLGRDVHQKAVKGMATSITVGGSGKSAAEWVSGLKEAVLRERSEYARTQKECETLAQHRLNSIAMGFVSGEGECIGIPELIPGRYIKIDGADENTIGTYFITKVCHRFDGNEYITAFEVKGAKT